MPSARKTATAGKRVGTKRSDTRWIDHEGTEWASKFEAEVYHSAKLVNAPIRKCVKGKPDEPGSDTYSYWNSGGRGSQCRACGSTEVGQLRRYTPDLVWDSSLLPQESAVEGDTAGKGVRYVADAKGYLRSGKRALLRAFHKARPDIDLRLIFERDYRISKTATITEWCTRTLRVPHIRWAGRYPTTTTDWIMPLTPKHSSASVKRRTKQPQPKTAG